mgnify:CR=1 FL=1
MGKKRRKIMKRKIPLAHKISREDATDYLKKEFKILANSILEENSEKFKKQNKDQIGSILS